MHKYSRRDDGLGIKLTKLDDLMHRRDGGLRRHRHDWPKIARRHAVRQVAPAIPLLRLNEREIGMDGRFQHVHFAIDFARFFAFRQRGAEAHFGKKSTDAHTGSTNTLGQVTLRHQFKLDFSCSVQAIKNVRIRLPRKRTNHLAHPARLKQRSEPELRVTRVVGDDGEFPRALRNKAIDQFVRHACTTEPANHDGGTAGDVS